MEIAAATRQGWKSGRAKLTRTHTHKRRGGCGRRWRNGTSPGEFRSFAPLIVHIDYYTTSAAKGLRLGSCSGMLH